MNTLKYNWTEEIDNRITELALQALENNQPFVTAFRVVAQETGIPTPNVSNRWNLKLKKMFEHKLIEYKQRKVQAKHEKREELKSIKRGTTDLSLEAAEIIKMLQQEVTHLRRENQKLSSANESMKKELNQLRQLEHISGLLKVMKKL